MNANQLLKANLMMSRKMTLDLINDMKDDLTASPTGQGGNHPLWVLGHLAYSEASMIQGMALGKDNPLAEWKELFEGGSTPVADASHYPSFDEVMKKSDEMHNATLALLDGMSDADFDKPAPGCPDEYKDFFGTIGQCLQINAMHPFMHYGQVADARQRLGRKPIMG